MYACTDHNICTCFAGIFLLTTWLVCCPLQWKVWHLWLHCKFLSCVAFGKLFSYSCFPNWFSSWITWSVIGTCKTINCLAPLMSCRISHWKTCNPSISHLLFCNLFCYVLQIIECMLLSPHLGYCMANDMTSIFVTDFSYGLQSLHVWLETII